MNEKVKEMLEFYTIKLGRKEKIIQPYLDIKNTMDGFKDNIKAELEYTKREAGIELIKGFIGDLKYLQE